MLKGLIGAAVLAMAALPAAAQTGAPSGTPQITEPSAQNSGTGISGKPGSKSGPAAKPETREPRTTGEGMESGHTRQQDSSKIPGKPGGKSGAPERKPGAMEK